ncbi:MAG TPA: S9 family peptidase [Candidatus Elarobacter sp.]|nr:S9 family peptidase [Candidatus Elarobacter sp.]
MRRAVLAGALLVSTVHGALAAPAPAPFGYDDVYRVASVSSPQISPDGSRVLYVRRFADREHDRWVRVLRLLDVATGKERTVSPGNGSPASPRWSPSGDRIAYLRDGGVSVVRADGDDARRVTAPEHEVVQFAWRPDAKALAFVALDPAPAKSGDARYLDGYDVGNDPALAHGPERLAHLWLQPLDGSPARPLGPRTGSVASGDAESTLSWSPDETTLAYVHVPTALANDAVGARIRLVDVATGEDRFAPAPAGNVRDPLFSPDGTGLAYAHSAGDAQLNPVELFVARAPGGAARNVSRGLDRAVRDIAWQPGSPALWFTATSGTKHVLYRSADGGAPHAVALGALSIGSGLDGALAKDGALAFVGRTASAPDEIYLLSPNGALRQLTVNGLDGVALASASRITYRTTLGVDGDAILTKPAGFRGGVKYPLVVVIHGGPTSAATEAFDPLGQLLAARGWLVLEPNYRGSNNLGARYQRAVGGDKLRGPGSDIEAALGAVRKLGIVDERRLAVGGWSYGAGLTLWMIARRHDWRAAVAGAAVTDIAADYATADDIAADRALLGGSPFVAPYRAKAAAMSPITYAAQVRTPLLLMTCRGDTRVSPVGVYEFYHALRDLGRPVRLVAYPVDGHFPSDPVRRIDVYRRWVEFIAERFAA